jgi:pentatricopeptide repeat protein
MDGFVRDGDGAGAVSVYNQMLDDEVLPDGMTFHLASRAHAMLVCTH